MLLETVRLHFKSVIWVCRTEEKHEIASPLPRALLKTLFQNEFQTGFFDVIDLAIVEGILQRKEITHFLVNLSRNRLV